MALINCPECNKEISDKAAACPHCGAPSKPSKPSGAPTKRSRSKPSKPAGCFLQLIGGALLFYGIILWSTESAGSGIPLLVIGIVLVLIGGKAVR